MEWFDLRWTEIEMWILGEGYTPWLVLGVAVVVLILGWVGGVLRTRRYTNRLLHILLESTPERIEVRPRWDGFAAKVIQPMPPFQMLLIVYDAPLMINPITAWSALLGNTGGQLTVQGRFYGVPRAELAWLRGGVPGQVLHKDANVSAWIHRRIAVTKTEFATRGAQVEPLVASFTEFYLRFNPALQRASIQQEMENQIEIVVLTQPLSLKSIPHLMASMVSMGIASSPQTPTRHTKKQV